MSYLSNNFQEVLFDYVDDQGFYHIDVIFGDEDDRNHSVAVVCSDTQKVYFKEPWYSSNERVQRAIEEVKKELNDLDVDSFKEIVGNLTDRIESIIRLMPQKGDHSDDCQKIYLLNKLSELEYATNGVTSSDFIPPLEED